MRPRVCKGTLRARPLRGTPSDLSGQSCWRHIFPFARGPNANSASRAPRPCQTPWRKEPKSLPNESMGGSSRWSSGMANDTMRLRERGNSMTCPPHHPETAIRVGPRTGFGSAPGRWRSPPRTDARPPRPGSPGRAGKGSSHLVPYNTGSLRFKPSAGAPRGRGTRNPFYYSHGHPQRSPPTSSDSNAYPLTSKQYRRIPSPGPMRSLSPAQARLPRDHRHQLSKPLSEGHPWLSNLALHQHPHQIARDSSLPRRNELPGPRPRDFGRIRPTFGNWPKGPDTGGHRRGGIIGSRPHAG